ncbi:recombinase-like helix-turn-helix domain-containing protein [Pigmentiphaga sp.]|uniref:recombinase-like helix-turn-helix domain-containing protein n=1 Tax=Pigmentiphaga sp. TaxID=1977564 RepID=UPI00128D877B|nr:recombinase-like helix-turn-helix domain-containing protein [Pigmentiphaga sp.]MPS25813.1 hypothetical protein [Alcaligenaceae bacterium SAGV5]MPS53321.1 hypothetical protein [Alcaligenaceae bacterium SAGV3]MPT58931.1 hypothetical protein [Alcaligenaceae bacterium]
MQQDRYLDPHQARRRTPTEWESLLGDSLERAFASGKHELAPIVDYLNHAGPPAPNGVPWTEDLLQSELARLAETA